MNDEMDVKKAEATYIELYRCLVAKDAQGLEKILSPSFEIVHIGDRVQNKDQFIQAVEDGTLNYEATDHHKIDVRIDGDHCLLVGKSRVKAALFGENEKTWHLKMTCELLQNPAITKAEIAADPQEEFDIEHHRAGGVWRVDAAEEAWSLAFPDDTEGDLPDDKLVADVPWLFTSIEVSHYSI